MAASTADRYDLENVQGRYLELLVKSATAIYRGTAVCVDANGFVIPADDAANAKFIGFAETACTAANADGTTAKVKVELAQGMYKFNAVSPATAWIGDQAYIVDDHTVSNSGGTNNVKAGRFVRIDKTGSSGVVVVDTRLDR